MSIPSKKECFYILEMIESSLIDYCSTQPWADKLIDGADNPPSWVCELSTTQYRGDQIKAVREHVFSEPFISEPTEMEKFHIACLWLRYERRELSWATFLRCAGEKLDASNGDWDCETPYHYLNLFEDAYFSVESEEKTKTEYLADHNLRPWIDLAYQKFAPFKEIRKANHAIHARAKRPA
jgi:hypothetical protein